MTTDQAKDDVISPRGREPEAGAIGSALLAELDHALAQLPPRQRAVWLMREVEGMDYRQIAGALSATPDGVRGSLHRARSSVRERLEHWR